MAEPFLALITPLTQSPPVIGGGPIIPPGQPPYPDQGLPPFPSHPIVIPPNAIGPGVPTHPIYLPVYPSHPIVIPPGAIGPGIPTHPIYLPPPIPSHPIVIPPNAIGPGLPTHPIVLPPVDPGYSPPWARPPVDPGYSPPWAQPGGPVDPGYGIPEGGMPHPEHPIVLPPDLPEHLPDPDNRPIEWKTAWTEKTGWVILGVPTGEHPTPSTA